MRKATARKATLAACVAALITIMALRAGTAVVAAEPPSGTPPDIWSPVEDETGPRITRTSCKLYENRGDAQALDSYFDPDRETVRPGQWVHVVVRIQDNLGGSGLDPDSVLFQEVSPNRWTCGYTALGSGQYETWLTAEGKGTWVYRWTAADFAGNRATATAADGSTKAWLEVRVKCVPETTSSPSSDTRQDDGDDETEDRNWKELYSKWDELEVWEREGVKRIAKYAEDRGLVYDRKKEVYYQVCGVEGVRPEDRKEEDETVAGIRVPGRKLSGVDLLNRLPWLKGGQLRWCRDTYEETQDVIDTYSGKTTWTEHDRVRYDRLTTRTWSYWDAYTGKYQFRKTTSREALQSGKFEAQAYPRADLPGAGKAPGY